MSFSIFSKGTVLVRLFLLLVLSMSLSLTSSANVTGAAAIASVIALASAKKVKCEVVDPSLNISERSRPACRNCDYSNTSHIDALEAALLNKNKGAYIGNYSKKELACDELRTTRLLVADLIIEESKQKENLWKMSKAILCEAREVVGKPIKSTSMLPKFVVDAARRHYKRENVESDFGDYCSGYNMERAKLENHALAEAINSSTNITTGNIIGKYCKSAIITDSNITKKLDFYLDYCSDSDGIIKANPM